jgi:hypothetical protein
LIFLMIACGRSTFTRQSMRIDRHKAVVILAALGCPASSPRT